MPKPRSKTAAAAKKASTKEADALADSLADKPYGTGTLSAPDKLTRITVSLPQSLFDQLEDTARAKRRKGESDWCMSAIVRAALTAYLK